MVACDKAFATCDVQCYIAGSIGRPDHKSPPEVRANIERREDCDESCSRAETLCESGCLDNGVDVSYHFGPFVLSFFRSLVFRSFFLSALI